MLCFLSHWSTLSPTSEQQTLVLVIHTLHKSPVAELESKGSLCRQQAGECVPGESSTAEVGRRNGHIRTGLSICCRRQRLRVNSSCLALCDILQESTSAPDHGARLRKQHEHIRSVREDEKRNKRKENCSVKPTCQQWTT